MRFIDFFAGIGGFRLGMEKAGHICVGHCEIDEAANRSYVAMHRPKEDEWYARDIRTVDAADLPASMSKLCGAKTVNTARYGKWDE